ncbi:MAG: diguanylate cyclase [Pseudomonadota bacterium]|nr:diguanylate cyclase [Pseudomonadota bacterium]
MQAAAGQANRQAWVRGTGTVLAYTLIYLMVDTALNRFAFSDAWTIIWPLNGVNVALLLMRPRSSWAWILLGIELGTGIGECLDDNPVQLELCQRFLSVTEVVISASLLPPFVTLERWLRTPWIFARFFAALVLGPGISGAMAAVLFHYAQGQSYLLAFNNWATADALGIAATMPLALSLGSAQMRSLWRWAALPKTLAVLILALAGAACIFSISRYSLIFLLFPLLLLVDSVLAFAGSAIAVVGVLLIAVYFTSHSRGPFGVWPTDLAIPRDLAVQIYFGFHMIALFPASIMFTERRRMANDLLDTNARLTVLASVDGLTGLANRRCFDERLAQEWNRAMRHRKPIALAMIDLDNFKQFNDLYGHLAGDRCLRSVADALGRQVKRPEDLVARFGGEEFTLLLPHTSAEGALRVVERIRNAVFELGLDHIGNSWDRVTVSIGYTALTPVTGGFGPSRLIQLADAALYQAKSRGRNRVEMLSIEVVQAANGQSTSSKNRIVRILGGAEREADVDGRSFPRERVK